jgi:hypothetical protein
MENLKAAFNHLSNDKVMHFLMRKFSNEIQLNDRREANDYKSINKTFI